MIALDAVGTFFEARRPFSRRRQAVIGTSRDRQECELAKLDGLTFNSYVARALDDLQAQVTVR